MLSLAFILPFLPCSFSFSFCLSFPRRHLHFPASSLTWLNSLGQTHIASFKPKSSSLTFNSISTAETHPTTLSALTGQLMLPTNHSYSSWPLSHTFPSLLLPHQITQHTFPLTPQLTERIQTTGNTLSQYPTTSCSTVACSIERMSCVEHLSVKGMPVSHRGRWGLCLSTAQPGTSICALTAS